MLHWWKGAIRVRDAETSSGVGEKRGAQRGFAEIVVGRTDRDATAAAVDWSLNGPGLTVEFSCGARIRLERDFDESTLVRAARALAGAARC